MTTTELVDTLALPLPGTEARSPQGVWDAAVAHNAGSLAMGAAHEAEIDDSLFTVGIREFLSGDPLNVGEQLNTMNELWQRLDLAPPSLDDSQLRRIQGRVEAHPDRRVVAVPLLDFAGRKAVAERAKTAFPAAKFGRSEALWTPDEGWAHHALLRNPEATDKVGGHTYGLRYHTADGVMCQSDLRAKLKGDGQAVTAKDGTLWLFPVMDVRVQGPRQNARADSLHRQADITQVPDSLLTMQLLHQANGTPNPNWVVDFTNAAVYRLGERGKPVDVVGVVGVHWDPYGHQIRLGYWWNTAEDHPVSHYGVRSAESGL